MAIGLRSSSLTSNPADSPGKIDLPDGRLDEIKPMARNIIQIGTLSIPTGKKL
jgi:hypothetical protein